MMGLILIFLFGFLPFASMHADTEAEQWARQLLQESAERIKPYRQAAAQLKQVADRQIKAALQPACTAA